MNLFIYIKLIFFLFMINTISSQENNKNFIKEIALEIINSSEYSVLTTIENIILIQGLWIILRLEMIL